MIGYEINDWISIIISTVLMHKQLIYTNIVKALFNGLPNAPTNPEGSGKCPNVQKPSNSKSLTYQ